MQAESTRKTLVENKHVSVALARFADLIRLGLSQVLESDQLIELVARDVPYQSIAPMARRYRPEVIIVDEYGARPAALARWKTATPGTGILVVVREPTRARRAQLVGTGATCVDWDVEAGELVATIRLVASGSRDTPALTAREHEVFQCLLDNYTHAEIGSRLDISVETARSHTASIRRKLGVRRNRELGGSRAPF